jgi:N-acetylneuraminic acid mutarotase
MITAPEIKAESAALNWTQLPPIPDPVGFAAPFAGVSGNALIVAGGANFPDAMPWEGGRKVWHDSIYVLPPGTNQWLNGSKLPRPAAYGISVTTPRGVLCAGGGDAQRNFRDAFVLRWTNDTVVCDPLPPLPRPLANACAALVGNTVFVAGGIERPDATNTLNVFWSLDMAKPEAWRELEPWPGPARMLAVAGAANGSFYLFSGTSLSPDKTGAVVRKYLTDAFRYTPGQGWRKIAALPRAAVAAPSPALQHGSRLLVVSGDDGTMVNFKPMSQHPGFSRDVLAYDADHDRWEASGAAPISRATVPVVRWRGRFIVPNGEEKPGRRTPTVWEAEFR